jgi:hypothetical protein
MGSGLSRSGQKTVIARYDVIKVLFLDFAAVVIWILVAGFIQRVMAGEPWPHAYYRGSGRFSPGHWAGFGLIAFVTITVFAPFLFHLLYAVVFDGAAAVYVKDGWLICHHPLMGRIPVKDLEDTRIETQTMTTQTGGTNERKRLVIHGRFGQYRKLSDTWLDCSVEDVAQRIEQEITRAHHATAPPALLSPADSAAHTFGKRRPI